MAVVTSVSAPCVVADPAPVEAAERGDAENPASATAASSPCPGSSASPKKEVSALKPLPKPAFVAPKVWMVVFGVLLAVCAGIVDAVTYRSIAVFTSHVTGTVARIGMRIEGVTMGTHETWDVFHCILLVSSFIFGSFLCGLVIPKNQVHFGGKSFYGVALLANSFLLVAASCVAPTIAVQGDDAQQVRAVVAGCLAAMACGLQNAMCTMHFGAVVRTTHVTGTATDIGSTAGRAVMILLRSNCRHRRAGVIERAELRDDVTKLCVLMPIFVGFGFGAGFGAFLHSSLGVDALFVPAAVTGSTGFVYVFFRTHMKRQLKKLEERRLADELIEMEGAIQRARSHLEGTSPRGEDWSSDLDELLENSLRVMHDVEATLAELCHEPEQVLRARTF